MSIRQLARLSRTRCIPHPALKTSVTAFHTRASPLRQEPRFHGGQYDPNEDPTPRKAPIFIGAGILIGALVAGRYISRVYADSPQQAVIRDDPDTKIGFPTVLELPGAPPLTLIGMGVRTVSFLGIYVYSVGFYADLSKVQPPSGASTDQTIEFLIKNTTCGLRIVPTRSTSYTHLRDGFIRAMNARVAQARKAANLSEAQEDTIAEAIGTLKGLFPNKPLAKHQALHAVISTPDATGKRHLFFPELGRVEDTFVAEEFLLAYFTGDGISPKMKKSVMEAIEGADWADLKETLKFGSR